MFSTCLKYQQVCSLALQGKSLIFLNTSNYTRVALSSCGLLFAVFQQNGFFQFTLSMDIVKRHNCAEETHKHCPFDNYLTSVCIVKISKSSKFSKHSFLNIHVLSACCFDLMVFTYLITKDSVSLSITLISLAVTC